MTALGVTSHYETLSSRAPAAAPGGDRSHRIGWIDGARGLSIVWMIAGHTLAFIEYNTALPYTEWFHLYVMRPVAPMFLLLLGMLWRPGFRARHRQFIGGMLAAQLLAALLGFLAFPNILVLMGLGLLVMPLAVRFPMATLALCVTQLNFWPMPDWWTGYAPGFVLALMVGGQLLPRDGLLEAFGRLGVAVGASVVGRYPLTFYLGHLLLFNAIVALP